MYEQAADLVAELLIDDNKLAWTLRKYQPFNKVTSYQFHNRFDKQAQGKYKKKMIVRVVLSTVLV